MKAWPFLFTRGHTLDNQLVLCPQVFKDGGQWGEFSRMVARLDAGADGKLHVVELQNARVGEVTLFYSEDHARRNDGRQPTWPVARSARYGASPCRAGRRRA